MADNPRQAETEAALQDFYRRADAGRIPRRRRYAKIGGIVGSHQRQRRRREQQRKNAGNWRWRP